MNPKVFPLCRFPKNLTSTRLWPRPLNKKKFTRDNYRKWLSQVTCLKEGNTNTHFFHNIANECCNKNLINKVTYEDITYIGEVESDKEFMDLFRS